MRATPVLLLLVPQLLQAQGLPDRNWHIRVPLSVTAGVSFTHLYNLSGEDFTQGVGPLISLNSGLTLTHRERWGIGLEGGFQADNYNYSTTDAAYSITLLNWRIDGHAYWLVPLSEGARTRLSLGLGTGCTYYRGDSIRSTDRGLTAVSRSSNKPLPFIAPEVGFSRRIGRHRADLLLKYQLNLGNSDAITSDIRSYSSHAYAAGTGNYLGVVLRFEYGFKKRKPEPREMPEVPYASRAMDSIATFHTGRTRLTLLLWDNAEVDGDTISVLVNGSPVLTSCLLTKHRKKLRVDLEPGANFITVVAHNEGRVPPNTASCIVRNGLKRTPLLLKTSMKDNDVIRIVRSGAPRQFPDEP